MKKNNYEVSTIWQRKDNDTFVATINGCVCTLKISYYDDEVDTVTAFCDGRLLGFYDSLYEAQQFVEKWCTNWKGR